MPPTTVRTENLTFGEARARVLAAALTIYDMLKSADRGMVMGEFALWEKRGGRSGVYRRAD